MATAAIVKDEAGIWREEEVRFAPDGGNEGGVGSGYEWLKRGRCCEVALRERGGLVPRLIGE